MYWEAIALSYDLTQEPKKTAEMTAANALRTIFFLGFVAYMVLRSHVAAIDAFAPPIIVAPFFIGVWALVHLLLTRWQRRS